MPAHDDDTPLSAPASPATAGIVDTSPDIDAATFDLAGFIGGVRPTRRTVALYGRADLVGAMDEAANRYDHAQDDDEAERCLSIYEQAKAAFLASVTHWTVEKRSSEWIADRWEQYAKAHSIPLDDGETKDLKARLRLLTDQLAGQVVEVKDHAGNTVARDVTADDLRALYDANEGEFNKLLYAMTDANASFAQSARVLTRDFSRKSSTARSGQGS